jgi:hypothetical protein
VSVKTRTVVRVMTCRALQAREREILDRYADALAEVISSERGAAGDVERGLG